MRSWRMPAAVSVIPTDLSADSSYGSSHGSSYGSSYVALAE